MRPFADIEISVQRRAVGDYSVGWRYSAPYSSAVASQKTNEYAVHLNFAELVSRELSTVEYGQLLTSSIFAHEQLRYLLAQARAQAQMGDVPLRVRLRLDRADPELNALHWELLLHPDDDSPTFLATDAHVLLSRCPESNDLSPLTRPARGSLSALVIIANPHDLERYRLVPIDTIEESKRIKHALDPIPHWVLTRGSDHGSATLSTIFEVLGAANAPEIVYLVCHGSQLHGESYLWLEDDEGRVQHVAGSVFAARVKQLARQPLLIVLAACESSDTGGDEALVAIGPQLAAIGVGAIIAVHGQIAMRTVAAFMRPFFTALRAHGQVDLAMVAGRRAAFDGCADWWRMVLFLRIESGQLWQEVTSRTPVGRRGLLLGALAVMSLLLLIFIAGVTVWPAIAGPAPMSGGYRVAVAQFGRLDASGAARVAPEGLDLANTVYGQLIDDVAKLNADGKLDVVLNTPTATGRIEGVSVEERAHTAAQLAQRLRADLLIYGNIAADGRSFVPEFYLTDRLLPDAAELTGYFIFGSAVSSRIDPAINPVGLQDLRDGVGQRAQTITQFIVGMSYYTVDDRLRALSYFEAAETRPGWEEGDSREMLYLFLGNTQMLLQDYQAAQRSYRQALALKSDFGRAQIGLAETLFQQARGSGVQICTADGADVAGLERAAEAFRAAKAASDAQPLGDIPEKAAFGEGRVYLCLSLVTLREDDVARARAAFAAVVALQDGVDPF